MSKAERLQAWSEAFGHVTAGDVWLFVVMMMLLIAGVLWVWGDE